MDAYIDVANAQSIARRKEFGPRRLKEITSAAKARLKAAHEAFVKHLSTHEGGANA